MRDSLIEAAKDTWLYLDSDGGGWMGFAGGQWHPSTSGPERLAQDITRAFSIKKRTRSSETAVVLRARSHLIRRNPEFDTDRNLLGLPDGKVADIGKDMIRNAVPADLLTRTTEIMPAEGKTPLWDKFLEEVLPDPDIRDWLKRVFGYMITGHVRERILLFCYGSGKNGKSTLIDLLTYLLGARYAVTCEPEVFCLTRDRRHPEERARLEGVRLAASMELKPGAVWNEPFIKTLTGGGDRITARGMYQSSRDFLPQCLLMIPGNEKPETRSVSPALGDRLRLIPFNVRIKKPNLQLGDELRTEAPAILFQLLREAKAYLADGLLPTPADIEVASEEYLRESNPLRGWIEEVTRKADGALTHAVDIVEAVNARAKKGGRDKAFKEHVIYRALDGMGYRQTTPQRRRVFHDIEVVKPADEEGMEQLKQAELD